MIIAVILFFRREILVITTLWKSASVRDVQLLFYNLYVYSSSSNSLIILCNLILFLLLYIFIFAALFCH